MTIILNQSKPATNYLILKPKQQIRKGDTIIFQQTLEVEGHEPEIEETKVEIVVASGPDEVGLMKSYQVISWEEKA